MSVTMAMAIAKIMSAPAPFPVLKIDRKIFAIMGPISHVAKMLMSNNQPQLISKTKTSGITAIRYPQIHGMADRSGTSM